MEKVKILTKKASEKGEGKPNKDEINEILRSPVRPRKNVTNWSTGDSPRERWLEKMDLIDQSDPEIPEESESHWSDVDSTYSVGSLVYPGDEQR